MGEWGEGGSGGGGGGKPRAGVEDTSAWHMWLAAGVGAEGPGGRMTGGCDCAGGGRCVCVWGEVRIVIQVPKYDARRRSDTFVLVRLFVDW